MSRIGKRPVELPKGVTVTSTGGFYEIKGAKGTIKRAIPSGIVVEAKDGVVHVTVKNDVNTDESNRQHGTTRSLVNAAIIGVSQGFKKNLKLEGTGYKAELKGQMLHLSLGLSHPVVYELPTSVSVRIPPESKGTVLQMECFDKAVLGQTVANIQSFRPPEPYKGKGVQVEGQKIRRKAGKAGGKGSK
ncbi:MAG: 50S ribosomal protein L6 [Deltaproteobacteria bacterium]